LNRIFTKGGGDGENHADSNKVVFGCG